MFIEFYRIFVAARSLRLSPQWRKRAGIWDAALGRHFNGASYKTYRFLYNIMVVIDFL